MLQKCVALVTALALSMMSASCAPQKTRCEAEFMVLFDTVTKIVAYTDSKEIFSAQVQQLYNELEVYHRLYDIYHSYDGLTNLKTINDHAGIAPVKVDQRMIALLLFAKELYVRSDGRINAAMGSVLSIWHRYRENGIDDPEQAILPPMEELTEAAKHMNMDELIIDADASTVFLADGQMRLDVGAIGKGYAVEQVCRAARAAGFSAGLVSVGGNVRAIGSRDGRGTPWSVGIEQPDAPNELLTTVRICDRALVTSGVYQRYYTVNGETYHHIIDPATLMPAAYFTAVTILCPDSGVADALSTAVFNLPLAAGKALIASFADTQALWVLRDGSVVTTDGWAKAALCNEEAGDGISESAGVCSGTCGARRAGDH